MTLRNISDMTGREAQQRLDALNRKKSRGLEAAKMRGALMERVAEWRETPAAERRAFLEQRLSVLPDDPAAYLMAAFRRRQRIKRIPAKEIAKIAGVDASNLAKILSGARDPQLSTLVKMGSGLGLRLCWTYENAARETEEQRLSDADPIR